MFRRELMIEDLREGKLSFLSIHMMNICIRTFSYRREIRFFRFQMNFPMSKENQSSPMTMQIERDQHPERANIFSAKYKQSISENCVRYEFAIDRNLRMNRRQLKLNNREHKTTDRTAFESTKEVNRRAHSIDLTRKSMECIRLGC